MSPLGHAAIGVMVFGAVAPLTCLAQSGVGTATVRATFEQRSAVRASTPVLQFNVVDPAEPALASVEFTASARTSSGAEVLLVLEPIGTVRGPGGAADVETRLALEGGTGGVLAGDVPSSSPLTAARWTGSGQRGGRLVFSLRASAPGQYSVPISLAVSVP
jgi:hypothetical protein